MYGGDRLCSTVLYPCTTVCIGIGVGLLPVLININSVLLILIALDKFRILAKSVNMRSMHTRTHTSLSGAAGSKQQVERASDVMLCAVLWGGLSKIMQCCMVLGLGPHVSAQKLHVRRIRPVPEF